MRIRFISFAVLLVISSLSSSIEMGNASAKNHSQSEHGYVLFAFNSGADLIDHYYLALGGGMSRNELGSQTLITRPGTLKNLLLQLTVAPGTGSSRSFIVRVNGVDTKLAFTLKDDAAKGCDSTHSVPVMPWDLVSIEVTSSGTPVSSAAIASFDLAY